MFQWLRFDRNKRSAGFALVDVILGLAILSVALVGIAFAYRQSTVATVVARNYNQATYFAQQALERLKVNDGKTSSTLVVSWTGTENIAPSGAMPAFVISTSILVAGEAPEYDWLSTAIKNKLVPVKATVTWQELGGSGVVTRNVTVISYYYLK